LISSTRGSSAAIGQQAVNSCQGAYAGGAPRAECTLRLHWRTRRLESRTRLERQLRACDRERRVQDGRVVEIAAKAFRAPAGFLRDLLDHLAVVDVEPALMPGGQQVGMEGIEASCRRAASAALNASRPRTLLAAGASRPSSHLFEFTCASEK